MLHNTFISSVLQHCAWYKHCCWCVCSQVPAPGVHQAHFWRGHLLPGAHRAERRHGLRWGEHPCALEIRTGLHGERGAGTSRDAAAKHTDDAALTDALRLWWSCSTRALDLVIGNFCVEWIWFCPFYRTFTMFDCTSLQFRALLILSVFEMYVMYLFSRLIHYCDV